MVKAKCPKCGVKWRLVQRNHCDIRDATMRSVIVPSESDEVDLGAFCKKCNGG
jgi:hypothetical protein